MQPPPPARPPSCSLTQVVLEKPVGLTLAPDPRTGQVGAWAWACVCVRVCVRVRVCVCACGN